MTSRSIPTPAAFPSALAWGLLLALAAAPGRASGLETNRSITLEGAASAAGGPRAAAATLGAGCWLEGEVELLAQLTLWSAPRTAGRAAALAVTSEAGLRWVADLGRWRPVLGAALGLRLPSAGRAAAPAGLLLAGLERRLAPGWALDATLGARWVAGEGTAGQVALGLRLYF